MNTKTPEIEKATGHAVNPLKTNKTPTTEASYIVLRRVSWKFVHGEWVKSVSVETDRTQVT